MSGATWLECSGCGASPPSDAPYPFACPDSGSGDVDHVLVRHLDPRGVRRDDVDRDDVDPCGFVRFRRLMHSYHRARAAGVTDEDYVTLARRLDTAVAAVDGQGFSETPFARSDVLSEALGFEDAGGVWVKDETGNVSGSHKGRHLMGVALHLEVAELAGLADPAARRPLAVASCGNAALAAAVVAAAARRRLQVFVPADADDAVVAPLGALGADVVSCERRPGELGDPAYLRLLEALGDGALPFSCQGNLNGLAIEGGETLGYEVAWQLAAAGLSADHLVVQVGGGALATACAQAFAEAAELGVVGRTPALHTVQTSAAHPLERAYRKVHALLPPGVGATADPGALRAALREAARHRSQYMWPWETPPHSIATGILDDETYDWLAVVKAMLATGGQPVVVGEERLAEANALAGKAGFDADETGTAGLAGLLELVAGTSVAPGERVVVLLTGSRRRPASSSLRA